MLSNNLKLKQLSKYRTPAFTIVELLIVIVIIGILAAIAIVSYTGITKKANESTVQAELSNAKRQISLYYAEHGVYPKALGDNNCLSNDTVTPNPDTRYCLKSSGGSTFSLTDATNSDYTLTLTKGTDIAYKVTKDTGPTSTAAVVAAGSFVRAWGGASSDIGRGLVQTNDGGYAVVGYTGSYGVGSYDMFLSKYDSNGDLSWNRTWGSTGNDVGWDLIQTSDGGYAVTGYTGGVFNDGSYDVFLVKYDSNGNFSWNKLWGGGVDDYGYDVVQTSDGGYAVTGRTTSFGSGDNNMLLIKYGSDGSFSWNKLWGGVNTDVGYNLVQASDGGYAVTGYTDSYGAGGSDMFLAKYNSSGALIWNKTWGGAGTDAGYGLVQSSDGSFIVIGYANSYGAGGHDALLAKYDSNGNLIWNKLWGGNGDDYGYSVGLTSDGGYVSTGQTISYGAGNNDVTLIKFNSNGSLGWSKTWGGSGSDIGFSLTKTNDGGYAVGGATASYGSGNNDVFLLKANASGDISNCNSTMCQTPSATVATPTPVITTPSATISTPVASFTTPTTASITTPSAVVTTIVAP